MKSRFIWEVWALGEEDLLRLLLGSCLPLEGERVRLLLLGPLVLLVLVCVVGLDKIGRVSTGGAGATSGNSLGITAGSNQFSSSILQFEL